ncbi:hypothetical protein [Flavobacterium sp. DG2-3]|uniref:hypothetical protein n=1 Tax=Flavobacterium sp. DG2-3 TaxID=3068317 RepID=UPI00273EFC7B|nr:hypothetical protein [Flavobacterium sp. DG2-3]MDP5202036.1 hypothetical protein [Flavobacterium sp. DG2-3]
MTKCFLLLLLFTFHLNFAQNTFPSTGNVGIGTLSPVNSLDVNGSIQISNSLIPMGLITELGGTVSPLLNLSLNFREYNKNILYIGGGFRIDSREDMPLFQWLRRKPNMDSEDVLMAIMRDGNVGIGILQPNNKLDVNGTIHSKEVKVDMTGWSDFVFKKEYDLPTLQEVEQHIAEKGHLENIPNEEEVLKNGIDLGEMNSKLLQKIEELTLYIIEQDKKTERLGDMISQQNKIISEQNKRLDKLENKP